MGKHTEINKQSVVIFWPNWRRFGSVLNSFSYTGAVKSEIFFQNTQKFFGFFSTMDKIIPVSIALTSSILEGENYHCRLCEASFSRKLNLNEHIRNFHYLTPNGVKKNDFVARCPYCDKSYGCEIFSFFSPLIPSKREKNILVLLS